MSPLRPIIPQLGARRRRVIGSALARIAGRVAIGLLLSAGVAFAQQPDTTPPDEASIERLREREAELNKSLQQLDWKSEYATVAHAVRNVFEQNRWNSPSDKYALELTLEVSEIPPWRFADRMRLFMDRVSQRYDLTSEQRDLLQQGIFREMTSTVLAHGKTMFAHAGEALETRLAGKPFTSDQVARWIKESDTLFASVRASADRLKNELAATMTPEQMKTYQEDVAAFDRRLQRISDMRDMWRLGKWQPDDWGLADDPIHRNVAGAMNESSAPSAPSTPPPSKPAMIGNTGSMVTVELPKRWLPYDPDTWVAYVVEQRERFQFDAAQIDAAESIHLELRDRAKDYLKGHEEEAQAVPLSERASHPAFEPVRTLFAELQERLESIPTTAQRAKAEQ